MNESGESKRSRVWRGAFGLFIGAVLGLIASGILHGNVVEAILIGSVAGFILCFLFGLDALDVVLRIGRGLHT